MKQINDRERIRAFERDWERRRQDDIRREEMWGTVMLAVCVGLFVATLGIVMGWW